MSNFAIYSLKIQLLEEEEVEVPVVKEPAKEGNKMDTDEASSDAVPTTESDVNMQDAKGGTDVPGAENGAPDSGDKPVQMETDAKVSSRLALLMSHICMQRHMAIVHLLSSVHYYGFS